MTTPSANEIMQEAHFQMTDDFPMGEAYARGALDTLLKLGIVTQEQHRLWSLALKSCPGHRDGGRVWCTYCGDLPEEERSYGERDSG